MEENQKLPEIVGRLNSKLSDRVNALKEKYEKGTCHFEDITGNLYNGLSLATENAEEGVSTWERVKGTYLDCMAALDTYLNLVELFPDFAEAEFDPEREKPYFNETNEKWNKGEVGNYHVEYALEAAKKLLGERK
tara:strand:+ start:5622 stop:6026 length:405 start_codon:yes stop_codon:yes gene_type:complete